MSYDTASIYNFFLDMSDFPHGVISKCLEL
jgi:hypothetical protein